MDGIYSCNVIFFLTNTLLPIFPILSPLSPTHHPLWPTIKTGTLNSFACPHLLTILIACYEKENPDLMCLYPFLAFSGENRGSPIFLFVCSDHSFPNYVPWNTSLFLKKKLWMMVFGSSFSIVEENV